LLRRKIEMSKTTIPEVRMSVEFGNMKDAIAGLKMLSKQFKNARVSITITGSIEVEPEGEPRCQAQ